MTVLADLRELGGSRELLRNLTLRELRGRYRGTALGFGWSLLNPVATMLVYTFVFALLLRIAPPRGTHTGLHNFSMFLLCGLLPWNLFSGALNGGAAALVGNANLITKVYFPREVLVASAVLALAVTSLVELAVLLLALPLFGGVRLLVVVPGLPLLVVLLALFSLGLALTVSVLTVYFRDVQHLLAIALQIAFYATPVIYPIGYAEAFSREHPLPGVSLLTLYQANPLVAFVQAFRDVLYDGTWPAASRWLVLGTWTAVVLAAGYAVFQRYEGRLAEEL